MFTFKRGAILAAFISLILPLSSYAAPSPFGDREERERPSIGDSDFYSPPAILVDGITVSSSIASVGSTVSGSFNALSMEDAAITDIGYRIELLSPFPKDAPKNDIIEDTATVYDVVRAQETFALDAGATQSIPFSYTIPSVLGGEYRIRIQLITSKDKRMGWDNISFTVEPNSVSYAALVPGGITIPEYENKEFPPDSGPNITPGNSFTLHAFAKQTGGSAASFTPVLDIFSFSQGGKKLDTVTLPALTLSREAETPFDVPLTAVSSPGVYTASLSLHDSITQTKASPVATYRWVVRGGNAQILALRLMSIGNTTGEKVSAEVNVVGPADAETTLQARLAFTVSDDGGVAGTFQVPDTLALTDAVSSGIASVTLDRNLGSNPVLKATLADDSGAVLDEYTVPLMGGTGENATIATSRPRSITMIVLLVLVLAGLVAYSIKRKKSIPPAVPLAIIIFFSIVAMYVHHTSYALATNGVVVHSAKTGTQFGGDWRPLGSHPAVEMIINRPIHNAPAGTYQRDAIPLEFSVSYASCNNRLGGTIIFADYLRNGGKISTQAPPAGNQFIRVWWSNRMFVKNCPEDAGCGTYEGGQVYLNSGSYSGTFNFDQLIPSAVDTTFRILAKWDWNMAAHINEYSENMNVDTFGGVGTKQVINLWLNFAPPTDLSITKTGPSSVEEGADITYTVQVSNAGPGDAQNVVVTDEVPAGLVFKPSGSSSECTLTGSTISCIITSIPASQTASLALVFGTVSEVSATSEDSSLPSSFTFFNRTQMVDFVNSLGRFPRLVPNGNNAAGFQSDAGTATALCNLAGYTTVASFGDSRFTHPRDNIIATWNGSGFNTVNAKAGGNPKKLHSLSCSGPSSPTPPTTSITPSPEPCTPVTVQNTASVSASNPDAAPSNNSSSVSTSITCPVPPPPPAPVSVDLLINGSQTPPPTSINTPVTLSWASTNADTCSATGDWTGAKVPNGSESATPTQVRTYTYTITCTNTTSGNTGTDSGTIVVNALAGDANRAPLAVAGMLINGQLSTFAAPIDVTQGQQVNVQLLATGSDDPDGWTHATKGVANGGRCEWNSNLSPDGSIDTVISNPTSPVSCDIPNLASVVGYPIVFNDPVGTYTYSLLRITDASGASSPVAQVRINVVARTYQCNDTTDNDGDALIDTNDPGCHTDGNPINSGSYDPTDDDETNTIVPQCSNGVDDADPEDTLIDAQDPGCHSDGNANNTGSYVPTDNDETNTTSGGSGSGGGSGGFQETR